MDRDTGIVLIAGIGAYLIYRSSSSAAGGAAVPGAYSYGAPSSIANYGGAGSSAAGGGIASFLNSLFGGGSTSSGTNLFQPSYLPLQSVIPSSGTSPASALGIPYQSVLNDTGSLGDYSLSDYYAATGYPGAGASSPADGYTSGYYQDAAYQQAGVSSVSPNGLAFIKGNEGFAPSPIADAGGVEVGYGHWLPASYAGQSFSEAQDQAFFANDVAKVESTINSAVSVPLSQNQFDAVADLIYNVGAGSFLNSNLLADLNNGDMTSAAGEFLNGWNTVGGVLSQGLVRRRQADYALFTSGSGGNQYA